ncbi:MAG: AMP-binding protein [Pseudomonadota bacterium]
MHPSHFARITSRKPAVVFMPGGAELTYEELERRANQGARLLRVLGVRRGDALAFCVENSPVFLEIAWAAQRAGAIFTPVSVKSSADDLAYVIGDCGAKVAIVSANCEAAAGMARLRPPGLKILGAHGAQDWPAWEILREAMPSDPLVDPAPGREMMYSSGTTGRPKGVRKPMPQGAFDDPDPRNAMMMKTQGVNSDTVFLCTSPLYHSAPYRSMAGTLCHGGTCVVMEHFDAELALECIDKFQCTHSLWVPTMFNRLLRLPDEARARHDLGSLRLALHGAASCPVHVKERMIAWWGPVLLEYYAGTEGIGACMITSEEWLRHKGSVGRAVDGEIHILDDAGREVAVGETGIVHFAGASSFAYWNDPHKTSASRSPQGWWTYGDIGHVDSDGYLYLTDRKHFMIISGGVNIYPQEIENALSGHADVADAAVFGIPNEDLGEEVKAVVQLTDPAGAGMLMAQELIAFCRSRLGPVKCPKSVDFVQELPRQATGKLFKRALQDAYRAR